MINTYVLKDQPTDKDRENSILKTDKDLLNYKSILYIGARNVGNKIGGNHIDLFRHMDITILEVYEPNVKELRKFFDSVIHGDIRDFVNSGNTYDIVMWLHGPEHLEENELRSVLVDIKKLANKIVILGCPYGFNRQGALYGNEYEVHKSTLYPEFFHTFGYHTESILYRNRIERLGTNITAWCKISE